MDGILSQDEDSSEMHDAVFSGAASGGGGLGSSTPLFRSNKCINVPQVNGLTPGEGGIFHGNGIFLIVQSSKK